MENKNIIAIGGAIVLFVALSVMASYQFALIAFGISAAIGWFIIAINS